MSKNAKKYLYSQGIIQKKYGRTDFLQNKKQM